MSAFPRAISIRPWLSWSWISPLCSRSSDEDRTSVRGYYIEMMWRPGASEHVASLQQFIRLNRSEAPTQNSSYGSNGKSYRAATRSLVVYRRHRIHEESAGDFIDKFLARLQRCARHSPGV